MSTQANSHLESIPSQLEGLSHLPEFQEILRKDPDAFTAIAEKYDVDLDSTMTQCKLCKGTVASDTIDDAEKGRLFSAMRSYFDQVGRESIHGRSRFLDLRPSIFTTPMERSSVIFGEFAVL